MYIYKHVNAKHSHAIQSSWNDAWNDSHIGTFASLYPKSGGFDWNNEELPSSTKDRSVSGVNYKEWLDKELTFKTSNTNDNIKIDYDYNESDLTKG